MDWISPGSLGYLVETLNIMGTLIGAHPILPWTPWKVKPLTYVNRGDVWKIQDVKRRLFTLHKKGTRLHYVNWCSPSIICSFSHGRSWKRKNDQKFGLCIQASAIKSLDLARTTTKPSWWHCQHWSAMSNGWLGLVHGTCPLQNVMGHHECASDVTEHSNLLLVTMVVEAEHKVTCVGCMLESPCVRLGHCHRWALSPCDKQSAKQSAWQKPVMSTSTPTFPAFLWFWSIL